MLKDETGSGLSCALRFLHSSFSTRNSDRPRLLPRLLAPELLQRLGGDGDARFIPSVSIPIVVFFTLRSRQNRASCHVP